MLSARAIASLSDDLIELYSQLEFEIKKDMFRRLNRLQKITDTTLLQAEIIKETGGLKTGIEKLIAKYDDKAQKQLTELFNSAMEQAAEKDIKYYSLNKREMTASQIQRLNTSVDRLYNAEIINKTYAAQQKRLEQLYNSITRMTLTVADASEAEFLKQCNIAYMKITSGAFAWGDVYKEAVNAQAREAYKDAAINLAADGVKTILYDYSGHPRTYSIEAATRMNVLTGINLSATQQTLENADELGTDLVEVSAHIGARDAEREGRPWANHAAFQGKIYCLNGERDYIDSDGNTQHAYNFQETCGLGEPDGICGINCRHSFYPYFEGAPQMYNKGELDEMKEKRVTLDNKLITPYEAEQDLRLCERNIRGYKARIQALELTGNSNDPKYFDAKNRLYNWQERARHITKETGIQRKYINEYIGTTNGVQPRGIKPPIAKFGSNKEPIILPNTAPAYSKYGVIPVTDEINGVKKGNPISFNKAFNINPYNDKYNCQICVMATKANLDGFNVIAKPYDPTNKLMADLAKYTNLGFIDKDTGKLVEIIKPRKSLYERFIAWCEENIKENNLYSFGYEYKGFSNGAHVLYLYKKDNNIYIKDSQQNGFIISGKNLRDFFKSIKLQTVEVFNISNCILNKAIADIVLEVR